MTTQTKLEFLFIDANVADKKTFINSAASNVKIVELNDKSDALTQIAAALQGVKNLNAIHIISHGSEGELDFANGTLNSTNLLTYQSQLKKIGTSLSKDGDILLYGCDVAKGDDGGVFINSLAKLTKADVAASTDFTGAASLGGDWVLENQTGDINSAVLAFESYSKTLTALPANTYFNSANGHYYQYVATSLSWADAKAAAANSTLNGLTGYLVTITSQDESDFLFSTFSSRPDSGNSWFGAKYVSGTWKWDAGPEAGQTLSYNRWHSGEPNGGGNEYAYLYNRTRTDPNDGLNGDWYDEGGPASYIVEYGAAAADTTPPVFDVAPAASNVLTTTLDLSASIDEAGTIYYVVVPNNASAPSVEQVLAGQDSTGTVAFKSGNSAVTTTPFTGTFNLTGLTASTDYDVYVVAKDAAGTPNVMVAATKVDVTTNAVPTITSLDRYYNLVGNGSTSGDYIELPSFNPSVFGNAFTLEAWVKVSSLDSWARILDFGRGTGSDNIIFSTSGDGNNGPLAFSSYNGGSGINVLASNDATGKLPLNTWTHVAATYEYTSGSTATVKLYKDGSLIQTNTSAQPIASVTRNLNYIGKSNWSQDAYTNGKIKDARVWSVARTAQEISDNKTTLTDSTGLYTRYLLNDGTGTTVKNSSPTGSSLDATIHPGTGVWVSSTTSNATLSGLNGIEENTVFLNTFSIADDGTSATVTLSSTNGTLHVSNSVTNGLTSGISNNDTNSVTVTGTLTAINATIAGNGITLTPDITHTSNFTSVITIGADDGAGGIATNSFSVVVAADNDAPTATNLSAAETFVEDTALNLTDIVVTDIDSATVTATLTLSDVLAGTISTATSNSVTSTFTNGVWTATGAKADVNTLLAGATFTPTANYNQNFTIATAITDGTTGTKSFSGTPVNDAPTISSVPNTVLAVTTGQSAALADFTVADVDSENLTVTLTATNGTIGSVTDADTNVAGIQVTGSAATINTALAAATFTATNAGAASIGISVTDAIETATATYNLMATNPPEPTPAPAPTPVPTPTPAPVFEKPVSKDVESQVPSASGVKGDGNGDGISDIDQKNVISIPTQKDLRETADTPKVFLSIELPQGQTLTKAEVKPVAEMIKEKPITFATEVVNDKGERVVQEVAITEETAPFGLFEFNLSGVSQTFDSVTGAIKAGTSSVKLYLDDNQTVEKYLKQTVSGTWEPIPFTYVYDAKLGKTVVSISLTDGDKFDLDGKVDGGISDPGTPIITPKLTAAPIPVALPAPIEKVFMGYGSSFELTSGAAQVFGSSLREVLTLKSGASNVVIDQNVEQVNLAGKFADYSFEQQGNSLKGINNSTIVAKVFVQDDSNGT
ncbi:MAG: DUF4347 domain-containing protein, partial [Methylococcales bacterium]|nr:DUF4347 domain-containing protein [Methylococcales bacterium]